MNFPQQIFKAYDIRGLQDQVTPEIAEQVGRVLVAKLGAKRVLIGRDMRATSPDLVRALIDGVVKSGGDVLNIGQTTTSLFNWALTNKEVDFGVMVTASHNPSEYNGMKVARSSGDPIPGKDLYELVQEEFEDAQVAGEVEEAVVVDEYIDAVVSMMGSEVDLSDVKIGVDYGNGMGALTVRPLMKKLGIEVHELYPEPDATFPNHEANPAKEETLEDLKRLVKEKYLDFGVALDGDVDRLKIIDNEGEGVPGDLQLGLMAQDMLKDVPESAVVVTINMGWAVREAIRESGGSVVECPVGRTNVISKAREVDALLGGETSGHMMFKAFNYLESVDYAVVRTLLLWHHAGKTMAELTRPLRKYANSGDVNSEVGDKQAVLRMIEDRYKETAKETNTSDGVKCIFEDWWFIVRPSNTEPVVRMTVEAKTEALMKEKVAEVLQVIETV